MFVFDKVARAGRFNFWIDEPQHFTLFNLCFMGFSLFSLFILAEVGFGFSLLGFGFVFHGPGFRKKYDEYIKAGKEEAEKAEVAKAAAQEKALKKRRKR